MKETDKKEIIEIAKKIEDESERLLRDYRDYLNIKLYKAINKAEEMLLEKEEEGKA